MKAIESTIRQNQSARQKALALLIDPDQCQDTMRLTHLLEMAEKSGIDFLFVGGSLLSTDLFESTLVHIRKHCRLPVLLFPGSAQQVSNHADALLMLSLISGRNPELLIGQHVLAAPRIKASGIEVIPTGYLLVDCGNTTTAAYVSQTMPIPHNKPDIAAVTVIAGEMLGLRLFYLDGGSGADQPVSPAMIKAVRQSTACPLIVGGGIRTPAQAKLAYDAGANILVVGTAIETNVDLLFDLVKAKNDAIFTA